MAGAGGASAQVRAGEVLASLG